MSSTKILAVGSALGSIKELLAKVKAIEAKHGKFDIVLATGDFFGVLDDSSNEDLLNELLDGKLEVFTQLYLMQGGHPLPQAVIEKVSKTGGQLCPNVFLLSKSGVLTTAHGLRIACLGGIYAPEKFYGKENGADLSNPYFTLSLLKQLLSQPSLSTSHVNLNSLSTIKTLASSQYVDVLLTHTWPASIMNGTSMASSELLPETAPQLDELVRKAKPRYHFTSCGGRFFEREPFCWVEDNNRISRFVSLGTFGSQPTPLGKKERWFYAFSITPGALNLDPQPQPANATVNPFVTEPPTDSMTLKRSTNETIEQGEDYIWGNVGKRFKGSEAGRGSGSRGDGVASTHGPPEGYVCRVCNGSEHFVKDCPQKGSLRGNGRRKPPEGYVCRACASDQHYIRDCPLAQGGPRVSERARGPPREIQPDECWFCLSNPRVVKHLIVAIGSECYIVLPRGQVPPTQTQKSSSLAPVPGGGHVLIVPVSHYPTLTSIPPDLAPAIVSEIEQFKGALQECFAKYKASPVTFEVSRLTGKGGHAHIQVVPIPNKISSESVEAAFRTYGEQTGIIFQDEAEAEVDIRHHQNYFRVELSNGKKLVHFIQPGAPFNLQFGRIAVANLLSLRDRIDWKACAQSEDEEREDVKAFKAAFGPFDPFQ